MLDLPEGLAFGIIFDAVGGQLRRLLVAALRDRRCRRGSACRTVADGAVLREKMNAFEKVLVGQYDRIVLLRRFAAQGGIERRASDPGFQRTGCRIRMGWNEAGSHQSVGCACGNDKRQRDARNNSFEHQFSSISEMNFRMLRTWRDAP